MNQLVLGQTRQHLQVLEGARRLCGTRGCTGGQEHALPSPNPRAKCSPHRKPPERARGRLETNILLSSPHPAEIYPAHSFCHRHHGYGGVASTPPAAHYLTDPREGGSSSGQAPAEQAGARRAGH